MDSAEFNLETGKRFIERARDSLMSRGAALQSNRGLWIALALGLIAGASVAAWRVREKRRQAAAEPDYLQRGRGSEGYLQGDASAEPSATRGLGADERTSLSRASDTYGSNRGTDTLKTAPGSSTRQ
ncbi:hypothetical protein OOT46_00380 [Aquabacterium sp. A7-Y]|uniref:hypothetical protein n=1 Tax=Aquabacterium sp. A7-Y TaxID=1349605 RepID=UPI00223CB034|nr:hypothetical protein [Aquabacterium sp. A7-Y]MCW7536309.1 hypothetical protein [Aquabacterium sp. A7-Y]